MTFPHEVFQLSSYAQQAGTDDPVPVLQAISMIDTDTLRHIGRNVWTESSAAFGPTTSYLARFVLQTEADQLLTMLSPAGWDDARYAAFEVHITGIVERMRELSGQCEIVGDALVTIADEFEMQWTELMGLVVAAIGLIVATVGLVVAALTWWTGVGAVAGLVIAVIGFIITFAGYVIALWTSIKPRLDALAEIQEQFNEIAPPGRWVEPEGA